jgi:hypothetical protein
VVEALLAPSPAYFEGCRNIVRNVNTKAIKPYTITNRGLQADIWVLDQEEGVIVIINCRHEDDFFCDLGLPLRKHNEGQYRRGLKSVRKMPIAYWSRASLQTQVIHRQEATQATIPTLYEICRSNTKLSSIMFLAQDLNELLTPQVVLAFGT